jgi:hypothetical protein
VFGEDASPVALEVPGGPLDMIWRVQLVCRELLFGSADVSKHGLLSPNEEMGRLLLRGSRRGG